MGQSPGELVKESSAKASASNLGTGKANPPLWLWFWLSLNCPHLDRYRDCWRPPWVTWQA